MVEENRVIFISSPEKADVPIPSESDLLASFDHVRQQKVTAYVDRTSETPLLSTWPTEGTITAVETLDTLGVTIWTLSNGVRVVLKPTDFKNDEILFIGDSDVDIETAKSAKMTAVACTWGFRSREELLAAGADIIIDKAEEILNILT